MGPEYVSHWGSKVGSGLAGRKSFICVGLFAAPGPLDDCSVPNALEPKLS